MELGGWKIPDFALLISDEMHVVCVIVVNKTIGFGGAWPVATRNFRPAADIHA